LTSIGWLGAALFGPVRSLVSAGDYAVRIVGIELPQPLVR
jgi:hypothetical protein